MTVTITIPDGIVARVRDGFCSWHGFDPSGSETKLEFLQRKLREFIKEAVRLDESQKAAAAANVASNESVETDIILS